MIGENQNEEASDEEIGEEDSESDIDLNASYIDDNRISSKHMKYTDLEERAKADMDFPDEVDTPLEGFAKDRFMKYRCVKSVKRCVWDQFEGLPTEYSKIWRLQHIQQI